MPDLFPVQIGQFTAQGFAVPQSLNFGGAQRLGVHQLPAGARVIDSMGPDESDIHWSGMFITGLGSNNPVQDAQQLDIYRVQGQPLTLSWDVFQYSVIVEHFAADEQFPSKVPFSISFKVVQNLNNPTTPGATAGASAGQASSAGSGGNIDSLVNGDMNGTLSDGQAVGMTVPNATPGPISTNPGSSTVTATGAAASASTSADTNITWSPPAETIVPNVDGSPITISPDQATAQATASGALGTQSYYTADGTINYVTIESIDIQ
jgi:hypothetical protein